ncbi:DNA polymerase III, clamp loader complex, gamma/delta/delta subunit [Lipomyces oligophaga]|uniref:DNA polymerase III, clamp loader complex, gamma/delta/delta subunit n=1 Tax=Lipomyces oligophaga TaxID=45792 RepID=UPI0034D011DC
MVECPVCHDSVRYDQINQHLDSCCGSKSSQLSEVSDRKRKSADNVLSSDPPSQSPSLPEAKRAKVIVNIRPLAELARPKTLDEFVGQENLVGPNGILRRFIATDSCPSMILWGPPGVGKTTLARLIAGATKSRFVELSATSASVNDCKKVFEEARNELRLTKRRTYLFLDEVHRFNRAQQDIFLPYIERGEILLIGATTENPSFKLNGALLSRCRTFTLQKLTTDQLFTVLSRLSRSLISNYPELKPCDSGVVTEDGLKYLSGLADGDGRTAINLLEIAVHSRLDPDLPRTNQETLHHKQQHSEAMVITLTDLKSDLTRSHLLYDRMGDAHYDTISALHKSIRGSDPDAALFYLGRMLESGESPLYIARRLIRMASEDIGLVDDSCLPFAVSTFEAVERLGMPECDVILAHCAVKLATAKKSVKVYRAYNAVKSGLKNDPLFAAAVIPIHLRNAPTKLMKELGYGKDYKYNPDYADGKVDQEYMPTGLEHIKFLGSLDLGLE